MANCLFCYQPLIDDSQYHVRCCKKFFGTDSLPDLNLDQNLLRQLAEETADRRIAVTGVQPKLSLDLESKMDGKRLTIVGLWGKYILKPQHSAFIAMPETEDLTMHLAKLFQIKTCEHCLIPTSDNKLAYIAKRFDRKGNIKIHMEDFCQLGGFQTEQKYDSSYERCGQLIKLYCTNKGLDLLSYFELLVFCFLSGNSDMHMKNFSLIYNADDIELSPAYDLINSALINPKDKEEMALLLSGRKRNIKRKDFENLARSLGLTEKIFERVIVKYSTSQDRVFDLIDLSFLDQESKQHYKKIWAERLARLS